MTFLNIFFNERLILFSDLKCWTWLNSFERNLTGDESITVDFVTTIINVYVLIFESRLTKNNYLTINFRDVSIFILIERI